jgi:16S rRNA C967 or C1407 C5-methylase (RsmB/RsmF family)
LSFELFEAHFQDVYLDRWPRLLEVLQQKELQIARHNLFISKSSSSSELFQNLKDCFQWTGGEIVRSPENLLEYYIMDPASVVAARALQVQAGDRVLDMCAAPGGKTLILAEALREEGEITANEISAARRERLKKVIQQYIPRNIRDRVWVTGKDGGLLAVQNREKFDRVLLDAPCSGERHLLANKAEMTEWTLKRSSKLAQRQYALLTGAIEAAKVGGRIVYSTCSISPLENDGVIRRILEKKKDRIQVLGYIPEIESEKTDFGQQYLPDRCGFGPLYFSVLEKIK